MAKLKDNFWFDSTLQGNRFGRWPFTGRRGYEVDLTQSIYGEDYGESFQNKKSGDMSGILNNVPDFKGVITEQMRGAFNLVNNGYTSNRILGKEWDIQVNELAAQDLESRGLLDSPGAEHEKRWRELGQNEENTSVSDFISLLTAERIAEDQSLVDNLKTKEQWEALGYITTERSMPTAKIGETEYYDISNVKRRERTNRNVPPVLTIDDEGDQLTLDELGLDVNSNFDAFLMNITKAVGVKFVPSSSLAANTVSIKKRKIRSVGRKVANYVKTKLNIKENVLPTSVEITYSTQGTKAEQAYTIIKEIAKLSTTPYMRRIDKLFKNGGGYGLPSVAEFTSNKDVLQEFATNLIASEMSVMFATSAKDAKILRTFFKLDAAQSLLDAQDDNKWIVPLTAGFVATSANRCASNLNFSPSEYLERTGLITPDAKNFGGAMFAKRDFSAVNGIYSEIHPMEPPEPDPEPDPEGAEGRGAAAEAGPGQH